MDSYKADLGAILEVFKTMPDYQQSLVISELQRTLERNLAMHPEPKATSTPLSWKDPLPKPKPQPPQKRSG